MNDKERRILEMQCPSTRRSLERPVDLDLEWFKRPIPKEAQVLDEQGNIFVNCRALTYQETKLEEGIRQKRGSWLAQMRNEPEANPTEHKKESAINAFMNKFTPKALFDKFKELMGGAKKELSYAEKIAASMKERNEE